MYVSGCSSELPSDEDKQLAMLFTHLRETLQQRLVVTYKMERYVKEQYHETLKKYRRLLVAEMTVEAERREFQRMLVAHLARSQKMTKRLKGLLTEFCFDAVERLAPALDCKLERHYVNVPKLLEIYLHSCHSDLQKKLNEIKGNGLVIRPEMFVGLLKILLEHIHKVFIGRLTLVGKRIDHMIDSVMRTQILLDSTAKSFYNFQHRKLKTDPSAEESSHKSSPYKRICNILPALNDENPILQSRKMSLIDVKDQLLEVSMTESQIPIKTRKRMPSIMKTSEDATKTLNITDNKGGRSRQEFNIPNRNRNLPCLSTMLIKSPSLKQYQDPRNASKDKLSQISATHIVRQQSPSKTLNAKPPCSATYYQFIDLFYRNLGKLYKTTGLRDLDYQWFNNKERRLSQRSVKKQKAEWLNQNLLRVIQYLTNKNNVTVKSLQQHATLFGEHKRKCSVEKFTSTRRKNIPFKYE